MKKVAFFILYNAIKYKIGQVFLDNIVDRWKILNPILELSQKRAILMCF